MLTYDIEADGLLDTVSKVHCIVTNDSEEPEVFHRYHGLGIEVVLDELSKNTIIAHNQLGYDLRVLEKLYPQFKRPPMENIIDTLVLSRLVNPDAKGGHSLEAWATRFIKRGLSVPEKYMITDWSNQSLDDYLMRCETDVMINVKVFEVLKKHIDINELGRSSLWSNLI